MPGPSNALKCEWEIGRLRPVVRRRARWIPSSWTSRRAGAWEPACFYITTQRPNAEFSSVNAGGERKEDIDIARVIPYHLVVFLCGGCFFVPGVRNGGSTFMTCGDRCLSLVLSISRVSTHDRFTFGYPLTSSGRSHGSVSVEGVFDMEVGGQITAMHGTCTWSSTLHQPPDSRNKGDLQLTTQKKKIVNFQCNHYIGVIITIALHSR